MHLKSLEVNGFKSFAKKGLLTFDSPISAIVGPNGSGKSNVAEAFRFVLGEQSLKNMRGKKGEDMIFNGAGQSGRLNKASVKLVFDNNDRLLPIDFDEVELGRAVHRDGANEYYLNGSQVRLKDITELLASANIGATGHHIISQGEADRILNASVKDRRLMLEDALGLKIYQYKKNESEKKLVKTQDNIKQVESLRREIAPHIKFLKKQVEKIEKGKEMQEELKILYREYLKRESSYIQTETKHLEEEKAGPTKRLEELGRYKEQLEGEIESHQKESGDIGMLNTLQDKHHDLVSKKNDLLRSAGSLEGQITSLEKLRDREAKKTEDAGTVPLSEVVGIARDLESVSESTDHSTLLSLVQRVKGALHSLVERYKGVEAPTDSHISEDLEKLVGEKKQIDEELQSVTVAEEEVKKSIEELQKKIDSQKEGALEAEKKILEVVQEISGLQSKLQSVQSLENTLMRDKEEYEREVQEAVVLVGQGIRDFEDMQVELEDDRERQQKRRKDLERLKIRVEDMGAQGGDDVMKEYQDVTEREEFLNKEVEDLEKSANSLKQMIVDLEEKINDQFKEGIQKINKEFDSFFQLMFGGGNASLRVVKQEVRRKPKDTDLPMDDEVPEEEEEGEEGVDIAVNLPRKRIKGLMMLSGGERALTSIALLFAMSAVNPPPFIILDETDAALDEANSRKYGDMIENLSKHSQLILITHNRETMSRAGVLYGVTMQQGISQILSIKFDEGLAYAK